MLRWRRHIYGFDSDAWPLDSHGLTGALKPRRMDGTGASATPSKTNSCRKQAKRQGGTGETQPKITSTRLIKVASARDPTTYISALDQDSTNEGSSSPREPT